MASYICLFVFGIVIVGCEARDFCYNCPDGSGLYCHPEVHPRCDGVPQCYNGEDERACSVCSGTAFKCRYWQECILRSRVCDGSVTCPDGSDEDPDYAGCEVSPAHDTSRSNTGINVGVVVGATFAVLAVVAVVAIKLIICCYKGKLSCDDCRSWCLRRDEEEGDSQTPGEQRFTDPPPEYASCVNQGFVPDNPVEGQQDTGKSALPSYDEVLKGDYVIVRAGRRQHGGRSVDNSAQSNTMQNISGANVNQQINGATTISESNRPTLQNQDQPGSLPVPPPDVVPEQDRRASFSQAVPAPTSPSHHTPSSSINTISGQVQSRSPRSGVPELYYAIP